MLNNEHYISLAGDADKWDQEVIAHMEDGGSLTDIQKMQHDRGRMQATLIQNHQGWIVVKVWATAGESAWITQPSCITSAVLNGIKWANEDADNREFFIKRSDLATIPPVNDN